MSRRIMAIYDVDPFYADRFAEAANQREKVPFTVMAFTSMERLKRFAEENPVEILLIDAGMKEEAEEVHAGQVVLLSDGEVVPSSEEFPSIYKYQSTDHIIREVMACYSTRAVPVPATAVGNKGILLGVYSPVNRCLKTSFALTLGQILGKDGSVLYLSLEDCSGFRRMIGQQGAGDFSDVLYYYHQGGCSWARLKSLVYSWDSLDYILPARYPEDLCQVSAEQMADLLGQISREGVYEVIVVDLGQFGKKAVEVLEICDGIYMPVKQDWISAAKVEEFEDYVRASGHEGLLDKIQKLKLPYHNSFGGQKTYLEQLLWGELGDYVRQLLKGKQVWNG
ncbi:MAG: hypothetical protein Q4F29_01490 [Lachnospiraceae bacterium]|nr:hypothetical protein [Lachnospiraceae bacterium]